MTKKKCYFNYYDKNYFILTDNINKAKMDLSLSENDNIEVNKGDFINLNDVINITNYKDLEYLIYITNKPDKTQYCSYITLKEMEMNDSLFSLNIHITEEDNYYGPIPYTFKLIWDTSNNNTYDIISDNKDSYSPTFLYDDRNNDDIYDVEKLIPILFCNYPTYSKGNYNPS